MRKLSPGENTLQIILWGQQFPDIETKKTKKETKQRKTKKEKITLRLILLINMDIRPLNKILALIQQYIKMIIYCCCSVAKSCPTLCNPIDCNMPELPVPNHFSEFAQVHVHWISDAIQPFSSSIAFFQDNYLNQNYAEKHYPKM